MGKVPLFFILGVLMSNQKLLTVTFSEKYGIKQEDILPTLLNTAFKIKEDISREQMIALLVVADQYNLNPFTKEIYAYSSHGGIVPVVGVDGWLRIINDHPQFDGMEFSYSEDIVELADSKIPCPRWIEVTIHRKDRSVATTIREYLDEVYRGSFKVKSPTEKGKTYSQSGPWQTHPKRMLRHKGIIQCARIAFSFGGIHDEDEAKQIVENESKVIDMGAAEVVESQQPGQPQSSTTQNPTTIKASANETLSDEAVQLVAKELIDRLRGHGSLKPAYDYVTSKYCEATQQKLIDLLNKAEKEAADSISKDEETSPISQTEPASPVQPEQNQSIEDKHAWGEQPSFAKGIGF